MNTRALRSFRVPIQRVVLTALAASTLYADTTFAFEMARMAILALRTYRSTPNIPSTMAATAYSGLAETN